MRFLLLLAVSVVPAVSAALPTPPTFPLPPLRIGSGGGVKSTGEKLMRLSRVCIGCILERLETRHNFLGTWWGVYKRLHSDNDVNDVNEIT